jgi:hypothetical protein
VEIVMIPADSPPVAGAGAAVASAAAGAAVASGAAGAAVAAPPAAGAAGAAVGAVAAGAPHAASIVASTTTSVRDDSIRFGIDLLLRKYERRFKPIPGAYGCPDPIRLYSFCGSRHHTRSAAKIVFDTIYAMIAGLLSKAVDSVLLNEVSDV